MRPVMSTAEAFSMSVGASGRLVELSRDECLELLGAVSVGRIAYTTFVRLPCVQLTGRRLIPDGH